MRTARRQGRFWTRIAGVALTAALATSACTSAGSSMREERATADDTAVLRIGEQLATPALRPVFDPVELSTALPVHYLFYVYDSLLREDRDGNYSPALAERAEIVDPSTIAVTLRPDLKFQDGTPLDAEAVKFTILRNKKAKNVAAMREQLQAVKSIKVTSPTELTIHLSKPIAGAFFNLLAHVETAPVSPTAVKEGGDLSAEPVGAGPFTLVSQSDQLIRLEKWMDYHAADQVHLAAVEIVNVASSEAKVNAYRTGEIDLATLLSLRELDQLEGAPIESETEVPGGTGAAADFLSLACAKNPDLLGDVRVRQALIYATDREALNKLAYGGRGEVQTQFVASASPLYDPELADLYTHDVDKAKALLAEAGKTKLTLTTVQPLQTDPTVEVLQQQWAKAGITLEITASNDPVQDFYIDGTIATTVVPAVAGSFPWTDRFSRFFTTGSLGGTCVSDDPVFEEDFAALQAMEPGSDEAVELYQDLTRSVLEEALFVPLVIPPTVTAWNDRIGQMTRRPSSQGTLNPDFIGTYVAAK